MSKSDILFYRLDQNNSHLELNLKLRTDQPLGKYQKLFSRFKRELNKSHGYSTEMIVYRGLAGIRSNIRATWTIGTTLEKLGIIWCAHEQWAAYRFTHNTSHFYNNRKTVCELWNNPEYDTINRWNTFKNYFTRTYTIIRIVYISQIKTNLYTPTYTLRKFTYYQYRLEYWNN